MPVVEGSGYFAVMDDRMRMLQSPFTSHRGFFARYDSWFRQSCPTRAERARRLARDGVRNFLATPGRARGEVTASHGGFYPVELQWVGGKVPVTPRHYTPACPCPDTRPWCKHAMALAYHMADLR